MREIFYVKDGQDFNKLKFLGASKKVVMGNRCHTETYAGMEENYPTTICLEGEKIARRRYWNRNSCSVRIMDSSDSNFTFYQSLLGEKKND